jgi:uncharacterized protein (TIGR02147 family)
MIPKSDKTNIAVFGYMDYRSFLRDRFAAEKKAKKYFSFRYFARITGFGSSGYLKMVMDGDRNLSPNTISLIVKAFKLAKKEAAYFEALVLYNQAKNDQERDLYLERMAALQPPPVMTEIDRDKYEYFTKRHFVIIREMAAVPDFVEDPVWIASKLTPPIKPKEAEHAVEVLLRLGLLARDAGGKLVQADVTLTTPGEIPAIEIFQYHGQMLSLAREALVKVRQDQRDITALTIPIPSELLPEIKKRIREFREGIIDLVNRGGTQYHEVYQINIQCFPVSRIHEKMKGGGEKGEA